MVTPIPRITTAAFLGARALGYLPLVLTAALLAPALERARALGGVAVTDLAPGALQGQALWLSALTGALLSVGIGTRLDSAWLEGGRERRASVQMTVAWSGPATMAIASLLAMHRFGTPPQTETYLVAVALAAQQGAVARLGISIRRGALVGALAVVLVSWAIPALAAIVDLHQGPMVLLQPTALSSSSPATMVLGTTASVAALMALVAWIEERT